MVVDAANPPPKNRFSLEFLSLLPSSGISTVPIHSSFDETKSSEIVSFIADPVCKYGRAVDVSLATEIKT